MPSSVQSKLQQTLHDATFLFNSKPITTFVVNLSLIFSESSALTPVTLRRREKPSRAKDPQEGSG
jgi:hypothetical protein